MEENKTPLVLAIDMGTSSVRTVLFNRDAEPISGMDSRRAVTIPTQVSGAVEVDVESIMEAVCECLDELMIKAGDLGKSIVGVGVCTFVTNILGLNDHWKPVTPLALYSDTRPEPFVNQLRSLLDEEAYHQRCGVRLHTSYWPAYLFWRLRTNQEEFSRVKHWMSLGDFLALSFFGKASATYSSASWTGLLNRQRLEWDSELLNILQMEEAVFSPLIDIHQPLHGLLPDFARRWPMLKDIPWLPAVGDGASANLGSGCFSSGQVAVTIGTTSAVRAVIAGESPVVPPGLWCYRVDRQRSLVGGAMTEGGSLYAWETRLLNWPAGTNYEQVIASVTADSHGLTFLPLLGGERCPGWVVGARGAVMGLSFATTPADLLRAGIEGVTYRIGLIYDRLRNTLPGEPVVVACGGALLHSSAWMQILADTLGCPIHPARIAETSARGTAILVLEVLGLQHSGINENSIDEKVFYPDEKRYKIYRQAMQRQQAMYEKLIIG
jgi:gluconokinase